MQKSAVPAILAAPQPSLYHLPPQTSKQRHWVIHPRESAIDLANNWLLVPNLDQDVVCSVHTPEDLFVQLASPEFQHCLADSVRIGTQADRQAICQPPRCVCEWGSQASDQPLHQSRTRRWALLLPLKSSYLCPASLCHLSASAGNSHPKRPIFIWRTFLVALA